MRILVTNDDGIDADGIDAMLQYLEAIRGPSGESAHEVWVVAPDCERSGVSHAMTLRKPSKIRKLRERRFSCSGTPADCVILAGLGIMDGPPDLVLSGINRGPNLGTDIVYSGTCGAARQAALEGIPAIAVSCASYSEPFDYRGAADFVARNLDALKKLWVPGSFVNVNVPSVESGEMAALWSIPGRNRYLDKLQCFDGNDGFTYCFLAEGRQEREADEISDHHAVAQGCAALSLVDIHPRAAHDPGLNGSRAF